jgi:hypothetical protein
MLIQEELLDPESTFVFVKELKILLEEGWTDLHTKANFHRYQILFILEVDRFDPRTSR